MRKEERIERRVKDMTNKTHSVSVNYASFHLYTASCGFEMAAK
jgi:hypothetical protein